MNDFDKLSAAYQATDEKPDKKYAMTATSKIMLGYLEGQRVIDIGCGSGFFTRFLADQGAHVIGVDNSGEQLRRANSFNHPRTVFIRKDISTDRLPKDRDILFAPFVLNYFQNNMGLENLFLRLRHSLKHNGIIGGIVDMPRTTNHDMREYGSIKTLAQLTDGEPMKVELWSGGLNSIHIVTLNSYYHSKDSIASALQNRGFADLEWHNPLVSNSGINKFPQGFWDRYYEECDCAFFTARKI